MYRRQYEMLWLKDGVIHVKTRAEETGYYVLRDDTDAAQMHSVTAKIYDDDPQGVDIAPRSIDDSPFCTAFSKTATPQGSMHWMDADALLDHPRTAFAASWQGFSYGIK